MTDVADNASTEAEVENGVYRGQIDYEGDVDWIAVELTAGVTYSIKGLGSDSDNGTLEFVGIRGIYDSTSNDVSFTRLEQLDNRQADGYLSQQAYITFTPATSGTYYVDVDAWGGGPGSYTLYVTEDQSGGNDDDTLLGGAGSDSILGGRGDDTLEGGAGNDYLDGEWGNDVLTGGAGADKFTFYSDDWDDIRDGVANLWGDDTITDFDPTADILHFGGRIVRGLDDLTITELDGNTILEAYWGDSVTLVGVSADQLTDANFQFRLGVRILGGNIEGQDADDSLVGTSANDTIYGHAGNDTIDGGDGDNYLRGFEGDDLIIGGAGQDIIGGEEGNDTITAGAGDDYILSNAGDDSVVGGSGNDLIETSIGEDTLEGGSGNDTLRPGQGDDFISGGTGNDEFVIGRVWGDDTISDFSIHDDTLDFRGTGLNLEDLIITADGDNTVISDGTNSLTLADVDRDSFVAAQGDLILEAGSVTSHYTEFDDADAIGDPTEEILAVTSVVNEGGGRWTPDEDGITRVSYSFLTGGSLVASDDNSTWWFDANEPVTPLTQFTVEQEIARIESYTNLDLVWVEDYGESGGNIRLGYHQFVIGGASSIPYEGPYSADVFVGIHVGEAHRHLYFVHELGHSLGFDDLDVWNELTGQEYTIMSYIKSARYGDAEYSSVTTTEYMYADIAGLQYLYGVDIVSTAGNNSFSYDVSQGLLETIFDAGGTDTISVYGTGDAVHINLTPGSWSNIGPDIDYSRWDAATQQSVHHYEPGTLFIMPNTIIENATAGDGDDTLTGNDANNRLLGGAGNDTIEAGQGADVLRGDAGSDVAYGGDGDDKLWAGGSDDAADVFIGGAGDDVAAGGAGDDLLIGGGVDEGATLQLLTVNGDSSDDGADTLFGGAGNDTILGGGWNDGAVNDNGVFDSGEEIVNGTGQNIMWSGAGDDLLYGAAAADAMGGGVGDDTLNAGGGNDTIYGGSGDGADTGVNDVINGGAGDDLVFAGGGSDSLNGGAGDDDLYSGGGEDTVDGGDGDDTLWGGGGNDRFTGGTGADTFIFASTGDDTVTDFNVADDELRLVNTVTDFETAADVSAAASEQNGGLLIDLGGGHSLFLEGLTLDDIPNMNLVL